MAKQSNEYSEVYAWLEKVRLETLLKGSQRRYDLLDYLVREELEGQGENLKAYAIALDVLGRNEDFDPATDSIVRVEIARLRDALALYYARSSVPNEPKITIPKGSYRPTIELSAPSVTEADVHSRRAGFWVGTAAALVATFMFLGWTFSKREAYLSESRSITILLQSPQVKQLSEATAEVLMQTSIELRQALSKRNTLTVLTNSETPAASGPEYELFLRAIGRPDTDHISLELIDTSNSAIDWADVYRLQTDTDLGTLASRMSDDLFPQIVSRSKDALDARPLEDLNPWELYLLSTWVPGSALSTLEWEVQRRDLAKRAITLDPQLGQAHSVLADKLAYLSSVDENFHSSAAITDSRFHAAQALQLAPRDPRTLFNLALFHWHLGEIDFSIQMLERAIGLDQNDGFVGFLVQVFPYNCAAAPDEAMDAAIEYDRQLKSDNPIRWVTLTQIALLHLNRKEYELALAAATEAHAIFHSPDSLMRHAAILNAVGRPQDAIQLIREEQANWPNLNPRHFADVTIPRRCQSSAKAAELLGHYNDLASAYQRSSGE